MSAAGDRLAIVVALEALEVGDQRYAVEVLLGALEDGPLGPCGYACECGRRFEFPGLLVSHRDRAGHWPIEEAA